MTKGTVTISVEEYESLKDDSFKLSCLKAGGVDNWPGYCDSLSEGGYFEDEEEDEE
jgi:hypothetical protein